MQKQSRPHATSVGVHLSNILFIMAHGLNESYITPYIDIEFWLNKMPNIHYNKVIEEVKGSILAFFVALLYSRSVGCLPPWRQCMGKVDASHHCNNRISLTARKVLLSLQPNDGEVIVKPSNKIWDWDFIQEREREREREIKFIGLFEDRGHRGPYSPYKPFNHNLYIGIIIFPHIDNPQSTGYN